ncbi:pyridoxal phosphate-dependent transferase [Lentinula raphanica]|nr:pyridoxal phosphate-dependent transferase [Lentinula raphanica]
MPRLLSYKTRGLFASVRSLSTSSSSIRQMSPLTVDSLNPAILKVEYAVRGELAIKAEEYRTKLKTTGHDLPFDRVISSNIGNPQQQGLDQPQITFLRQLAALMEYPALAELAPGVFPEDVVQRAKQLQNEIGSIGAYSHSQGVPLIREHVAKFIEERDGYPSDPKNIFLTAGASAVSLYTATIAQYSGKPIPYYLDGSSDWSTSLEEIKIALDKAEADGTKPKALVVINPGNPTGALLSEDTQIELIHICEKHDLVLLADEVYQSNLHKPDTHPFTSFKKLVSQLRSTVPLVSFHSVSKGVLGECGRRGGYFECTNISPEILALIYKMVSVGLCPPLQGQIAVDTLVRPPKQGDQSYPKWKEETDKIHAALAERTRIMADRLNKLPGVECVNSPGALYLYPKITLSDKAIAEAEKHGKQPDAFYALQLLDETGICVVPGSGFGQREGHWHYRLTCLCPGVEEYVGKLEKFHHGFIEKYGV